MSSYPEIESIIGLKYKLSSILGNGATACVYKAHHRYLQQDVALKILSPQLALKDKKIEDIFFEEAANLAQLKHKNILSVMDADKSQGYCYMATELLKGDTLEYVIKDRLILNPVRAINIVKEVCRALEHALKFGFVHRDIKPANIMILENDKVKILDFGLSKKIGEPVKYQIIGGPMCGTLFYMSPEQLTDSERVDHRADLYSIGVTLYHMLIGKVPFETNDLSKLVSMQINNSPNPPVNLSPDVSYELSSIIMKLLEKSASKRYNTYQELIEDLDYVLADYAKNEEPSSPEQFSVINDESFILSNLKEKYLLKVKEKSVEQEASKFNSSITDSTGLQKKYLNKLNKPN